MFLAMTLALTKYIVILHLAPTCIAQFRSFSVNALVPLVLYAVRTDFSLYHVILMWFT